MYFKVGSANFYTSANVEDGKIVRMFVERGREGGPVMKGFQETLLEALASHGYSDEVKEFYKKVVTFAYKEKGKYFTLKEAIVELVKREETFYKDQIEECNKRIRTYRAEMKRVKERIGD